MSADKTCTVKLHHCKVSFLSTKADIIGALESGGETDAGITERYNAESDTGTDDADLELIHLYFLKYIRFIILHIILSKGYRPYSEHFLCKLLILINISLSLCFADSYSRISAGRKSCDGPPVFLSIKYEPCTYWLPDCLFYKNYLIFRQDKLLTVRFPERRRNSRQPSGSCPGCRNSPSTVWFDLTYNHKIR